MSSKPTFYLLIKSIPNLMDVHEEDTDANSTNDYASIGVLFRYNF